MTQATVATRVYATRHTCGRICAAAVANERAAKDVALWVKEGRVIETLPIEQARTETWCSCFRLAKPRTGRRGR